MYPPFADTREIDRAIDRIMQAILERRIDFLFGAGMSVDSGVPAGAALADRLLQIFFPPTGTDPPTPERREELTTRFQFEALVQAVEEARGTHREDLTRDLKRILTEPDYKPCQAHYDFLSVCLWEGAPPMLGRVFTTNFDGVLQQVLGGSAHTVTEENTREIAEAQRQGKIPVIHLHGTLESGKYQITESDLFDRRFRSLHSTFRSALNEAEAFVFVGYSMNDPDFRSLYLDYREDISLRRTQDKKTYVVSPVGDGLEYDLARAVWRSRGAVLIPLTAAQFFARLKHVMETGEEEKSKSRIMRKYGLADDQAYQDKLSQTAEILNVDLADAARFLLETRTRTGGRP